MIAGLSLEQRGLLLDALLNGESDALEEGVGNIYKYIMLLQQELADKKQKMRELGAKGGSARKKAEENLTADLFGGGAASLAKNEAAVKTASGKRKEAKEKNILNKKIKNLFISSEKEKAVEEKPFTPPLVEEVRAFIKEEGLNVDADTFVDFYDSHGWKVGQTAIRNWQATVRLWHRRSGGGKPPPEGKAGSLALKDDDEAYWHELAERNKPFGGLSCGYVVPAAGGEKGVADKATIADEGNEGAEDCCCSPFVRFIRRIEDNDNYSEGQNE